MEIWKPIVDLDGKYEASTDGRIRHSITKHIKAQIFDGHYYKFGYDYYLNHKRLRGWYRVHKAVAETFIPNPDKKPTVNHIDGDHANNAVENLEWATAKEQSVHAAQVLRRQCGENHYNAKFTNSEVKEMRRLFEKENMTVKEIAERYHINSNQARRIVKYERWKNI